ncbi:MAG: hypothetical protein ACLQUZ_03510 [Rhizomicrobium sp.]
MNRLRVCVVAVASGLAACTYQVEANTSEPAPVVTAYTAKVPGKWALLIGTERATAALQAAGLRCSDSDYPLDLTKSFAHTAAATFRSVAEDIRVVDHPLSKSEFASEGYTGVIKVEVEALRAKLNVEGIQDATADANTEIDGTILVTKAGRRLVDSSETGTGTAQRDAGLTCDGAAVAVSAASDEALQDVIRKLAEQFANSHDIRYSVPSFTPAMSQ